jgi:two-component system LytT family response regulator
MNPLRAVIVDDERLARKQLAKLLEPHPFIELAGEAGNLEEAIHLCTAENPDLVFLDISMPPDSGFDLLAHLQASTQVVFVTAHETFAIRAFEENALDYLLKPIKPERLAKALNRLQIFFPRHSLEESPPVDLGKGIRLALDEIIAVTADGNYSRILLRGGGNVHLRRTMHEWVKELAGRGFIQPGRSLLLLSSAVLRIEARSRDESFLYLSDRPVPLKISRRLSARIRQLLEI